MKIIRALIAAKRRRFVARQLVVEKWFFGRTKIILVLLGRQRNSVANLLL
jgi:hypothetical protein